MIGEYSYLYRIFSVFPNFLAKRQQMEKFIKCAEVRTKKEFLYTICAGVKILIFWAKLN